MRNHRRLDDLPHDPPNFEVASRFGPNLCQIGWAVDHLANFEDHYLARSFVLRWCLGEFGRQMAHLDCPVANGEATCQTILTHHCRLLPSCYLFASSEAIGLLQQADDLAKAGMVDRQIIRFPYFRGRQWRPLFRRLPSNFQRNWEGSFCGAYSFCAYFWQPKFLEAGPVLRKRTWICSSQWLYSWRVLQAF